MLSTLSELFCHKIIEYKNINVRWNYLCYMIDAFSCLYVMIEMLFQISLHKSSCFIHDIINFN